MSHSKIKRALAVLMTAAMIFTALPVVYAASGARLYNIYGDHMLFQQNADAVFTGEASPGGTVRAALKNAAGTVVASGAAEATADGTFSVSFPAPAGSDDAYTVTLTENGALFATLSDVCFGELWLSFGQSNMEYNLGATEEGAAMQTSGVYGDPAIRVLQVDHPTANGAFVSDKLPQTEPQSCRWYAADSAQAMGVSAVAYSFAECLRAELNVPVGILNVSVGGSGLSAWLPRAAAEGDDGILGLLREGNSYLSLEDWDKADRQFHLDLSGLFNSKVAPLKPFRPAGAIWYQGETDLMLNHSADYYKKIFASVQDSYTAYFALNETMPLIFCEIAAFDYGRGPFAVTQFNEIFSSFAAEKPDCRAVVDIGDVSLAFLPSAGSIHPMVKFPIGGRMAQAALGLCYGAGLPAGSPVCVASSIDGDGVALTFSNVGEGLAAPTGTLSGFAVYGEDGICYPAEAEIVSADTVRVSSVSVPAPAGAVYAANEMTERSLWSSHAGQPCMPACPCGTTEPGLTLYSEEAWQRCESLSAWQYTHDPGVLDTWRADRADLSLSADAAEGNAALRVEGTSRFFTVSTVTNETVDMKLRVFDSCAKDRSAYGTFSVQLKNTGEEDVRLESVRFYTDRLLWYSPVVAGTQSVSAVLPADGAWHTYTFSLKALLPFGSSRLPAEKTEILSNTVGITFSFSGGDAELLLDDCRFGPADSGTKVPQSIAAQIFARLRDELTALFERIRSAFASFGDC